MVTKAPRCTENPSRHRLHVKDLYVLHRSETKASDHNVKMQFINALMLTSYVNFCTNLMFYLLLLYYLIHNQSTVSLYLQDYISITVPVY